MPVFVADSREEFKTEDRLEIKFIEDMENSGIPWMTYSGRFMYGRRCPAASTSSEVSKQDIYRATTVELKEDNLGLGYILYTG